MIIRPDGSTLLCITQPDHAALAADVMSHWADLDGHPRRDVILLAVRRHDEGWIEEDAALHIGADGRLLDFMHVPADVKHRIWPRAVSLVGRDDPYAGALVAQHALTVHRHLADDPAWASFFAGITAGRDRLLSRCQVQLPQLEADYTFVRIGDLLSLVFCNGWREPFDLPSGRRTRLEGDRLRVTPDPFGGALPALQIGARRIPERAYGSAAEVQTALREAPLTTVEGTAAGGGRA